MNIDIDRLTEAELIDLNRRIVARIRLMRQIRDHNEMMEYRIGDRVSFEPRSGHTVVGVVTKFNRKTVTVISDNGHQWNVAPSYLRRPGQPQPSGRVTVEADATMVEAIEQEKK